MNIEIIRSDKNSAELRSDNVTVAEVLRAYLNQQGIDFAAWRREHPSKPIIFRIESNGKTVKKAVGDAADAIKKDLNAISKALKK